MEYYIVDAFAEAVFQGNPAGVCVVEKPLRAALMQKIAAENNLPETAFLAKAAQGYTLRWFTPMAEIDLCGHATLAAAFVVANYLDSGASEVLFLTMSGTLVVRRKEDYYELFLPLRKPEPEKLTPPQLRAVGCRPVETFAARDLLVVLDNEREVRDYKPDYDLLERLARCWLGIVITAKGDEVDFVSRYFCPELRAEDPVTGSSHCSLAPYWGERLRKEKMTAAQLSQRGGIIHCEIMGNSVKISGKAVLYMRGNIVDVTVSECDK